MPEQTEYRLALILPESRQLLGIRSGETAELPRLSIPSWERPVEQLTRIAEEQWKIKSIVLDFLSGKPGTATCAVMEVRNAPMHSWFEGFHPVSPEELSESSLGEEERGSLLRLLSGDDTDGFPFSRVGWIDEARQWIQQEVRDREIHFNGDILQLNTGGGFALIRFGSESGPAYWLKAAGEPNAHEFGITTTLANLFPDYLPRLVAAREDWNAWVTEDAGGTLRSQSALPLLEQAVQRLTELQLKSIDYAEALMSKGFALQNISTLQMQLEALMEYLEEAMGRQTSTRVPPLLRSRLYELRSILDRSCSTMIDLQIPDTLVHNDLNVGNILYKESQCVFTDWAETFIGNPFITRQCQLLGSVMGAYLPVGYWIVQWPDRSSGLRASS
jgi:hypothetical protein